MNINLTTWYSDRELDYCPLHFVTTSTPIDEERQLWILENLKGRYHISYKNKKDDEFLYFLDDRYPSFEDPQEAVLYELTFS